MARKRIRVSLWCGLSEKYMRIDYEYIGQILRVFLDSESPTEDWDSFAELRADDGHKFVFHISILVDRRLMVGAFSPDEIGILHSLYDYVVSIVPWRLTADGHDFANALDKPSVMAEIQEKFKQEGLSVVIEIAKKIATKQANRLLDN